MSKLTLLTGGARSGKSSYALSLAEKYSGQKAFIATATALDEEMEIRIAAHKKEREGKFLTIEEPYNLNKAVQEIPEQIEVAIIDCLTVWLGNLFYKFSDEEGPIKQQIINFIDSLFKSSCDLILVTNELGSGIIPENAMVRSYRDLAGFMNCAIARQAKDVYHCVCGIPQKIK